MTLAFITSSLRIILFFSRRLGFTSAKVGCRAVSADLKCISRKFFLPAERNWREKPSDAAYDDSPVPAL